MRELLSGALPAPRDEPQQRDVIDAAMDWGARRRRRDWALSGAAALAVLAVGTGVAAMSGGSGNGASPAGGARPTVSASSPGMPAGTWWTPYCATLGTPKGSLADYCRLFDEQQNYNVDFAKGSVPSIQAALPAGFTVKATDSSVLILTGPNSKTNYLFPSAEPASTLDGHALSCGTPAPPTCIQTSTAGGTVVVNNWPSGAPSAGYVAQGLKDPRVDLLLGTSVEGSMKGVAPPTSAQPLLSNAQLARVLSDPGFLAYAREQVQHLTDIANQLQSMAPLSPSGSLSPIAPAPVSSMSGFPLSGATNSWSSPTGRWSSPSGPDSSGSQSSVGQSSGGQSSGSQSSGSSQPSDTGSSSGS